MHSQAYPKKTFPAKIRAGYLPDSAIEVTTALLLGVSTRDIEKADAVRLRAWLGTLRHKSCRLRQRGTSTLSRQIAIHQARHWLRSRLADDG